MQESKPKWKRLVTRRYLPTPQQSLLILRGTVALIFMAHALVRLVNGSVPQFASSLEARGFPWGTALVMSISAYEIIGGSLLALGIRVKVVCSGLAFIVLMGIVIIHRHLGWFVGEHGTGGMEFSWLLVAALLVVAATDSGDRRARTGLSKAAGQAD
ncbi:MAG: DoxX family protein [Dokdonella sp.]